MSPEHLRLWQLALSYLNVRRNDLHSVYAYGFAKKLALLERADEPEALVIAAMVHDVGWSAVPNDKIMESFGPAGRRPDLKREHETAGVAIATRLLRAWGADGELTESVTALIDGHDTFDEPISRDQQLLREADKLWCFTPAGFEIVRGWFDHSVVEHWLFLEEWLETRFRSQSGVSMAHGLHAVLWAEQYAAEGLTPGGPRGTR